MHEVPLAEKFNSRRINNTGWQTDQTGRSDSLPLLAHLADMTDAEQGAAFSIPH